jgi:hypothetical protein
MKRTFKFFLVATLFICFFVFAQNSRADGPPPPPPGGGHGGGGNGPPGGGAPIDGGLSILLIAGAAYGARKLNQMRNKEE